MSWGMKNDVGIRLRRIARMSSTIRCVLNWFKIQRTGSSLARLFLAIPTSIPGPMVFGKPFGNCTQTSVTRTPNEHSRAALICNPRRKEGALGPVAGEQEPLQRAEAVLGREKRNRVRGDPLRHAKSHSEKCPLLTSGVTSPPGTIYAPFFTS